MGKTQNRVTPITPQESQSAAEPVLGEDAIIPTSVTATPQQCRMILAAIREYQENKLMVRLDDLNAKLDRILHYIAPDEEPGPGKQGGGK